MRKNTTVNEVSLKTVWHGHIKTNTKHIFFASLKNINSHATSDDNLFISNSLSRYWFLITAIFLSFFRKKLLRLSYSNGQVHPRYPHIHVLLIKTTWLCLRFFMCYYNITLQNDRPEHTELTLQLIMASPQLCYTTNSNGFTLIL